jgi:uncharacterized protein (TIGR02266 family)
VAASLSVLREFKHLEGRRIGSGLAIEEFERWMRLKLELDKMQGDGPNRRRSFRIPTHLLCSLVHQDDKRRMLISNLSGGGAFIETRAPLPLDSRIELTLETEQGKPLRLQAVVVTTRIDLNLEPGKHGMGIRFVDLGAEERTQLARLYQALSLSEDSPDCSALSKVSDVLGDAAMR